MRFGSEAGSRGCTEWVAARQFHGEGKYCDLKATVERNGKKYCTRHDPERVARQNSVRREAEVVGRRLLDARDRLRRVESQALRTLRQWSPVLGDTEGLIAARNALQEADEELEEALEATKANDRVPRFFSR